MINLRGRFRLPTEVPLENYPKPEEFIKEAKRIVDIGNSQGVPLRIMGGLAIYIKISEKGEYYKDLWTKLSRLGERVFTDIDLVSYGAYREQIVRLLNDIGYELWQPSLWKFGGLRYIFYSDKIPMVEVFFDKLKMNHEIIFKNRLEIEKYTIPLADLLLTKFQIVNINEKDLKDIAILIRTFEITNTDQNAINGLYIAKILAKDWGFYYTFMINLRKFSNYIQEHKILDKKSINIIINRLDKLVKIIESEPKTMRWKLRAKIGPKKKWYEEVEDWIY